MKRKQHNLRWWHILKLLVFPLGIAIDGLKAEGRSVPKKILVIIASVMILFFWLGGLGNILQDIRSIFFATGVWTSTFEIPVSGASMLPTIKDASTVKLTSVGGHTYERGDIVTFTNTETDGQYYLKRIIGLPGDMITLKNGQVFVNNTPLKEPYIYQNAGTYGNTFLLECQAQSVPKDSFFVMGDNRPVSWDSRAIGFIDRETINGFLKPAERPVLNDAAKARTPGDFQFSSAKAMELINAKRVENKVGELLPSALLSTIAKQRSGQVAENLNSWKTNSLPVEKTLDGLGYRYNLAYEFVTFGFLDEEGLVNQIMENPDAKNAFLSGKFWEGGVGFTQVTDGDCTYPVISVLLTWPSVPSYSQTTIDWWQREVTVTSQTLSNLQSWVGFPQKNQETLKESITLTATMNTIASRIVTKMKNKSWLDQTDYADMNTYGNMVQNNSKLLDQLFPDVKGQNTDRVHPVLL